MKTTKRLGLCATAAMAALALGGFPIADADGSGWQKTHWGWFGGHRGHDPKACVRSPRQLERNVRTVVSYYTLAFNAGEPELAVERYVGVDENGEKLYIQHNPFAEDGPDAFIAFVNFFKSDNPDLHVDIIRTIAQCDLVVTHSHITTDPDDLGSAAMDIFRLDRKGKIVEHWDAVQPVEEFSLNDNTQF
jgi:predicted SnoaL-like aldol condensation-catalyzing enzyme